MRPFITLRQRDSTPLCPAGHLPRTGGDQLSFRAFANHQRCRNWRSVEAAISLLAGEMAGRPEGGAVP
ncbi:MAG: hypothetical protein EOS27_32140, partial [Mesorhizobium sp.]